MNSKLILLIALAMLLVVTAWLFDLNDLYDQQNSMQSSVAASSTSADSSSADSSSADSSLVDSILVDPVLVDPVLAGVAPAVDNSSYFQGLLTKGLTTQEAQLLILYNIKQQYFTTPPKTKYWQPFTGNNPLLDVVEQAHQVRTALLKLFGEAAKNNMLFKDAFYPLAHEADYLSSADQIAIFEQIVKRQVTQAELMRKGLVPAQLSDLSFSMGDPSDILAADAAFEWKLRKSYLAQRLRNSGVSFDEQTFRDSYKLLAPIYDIDPDAVTPNYSDLSSAFNGLETLLGEDDANRVQASLDPGFPQFQHIAEQQGLNPDQVLTAYGIISDGQAQLMSAIDTMSSGEDGAMQLMNQATATRDGRLASFIGHELAQQLIDAYEMEVPRFIGQEATEQLIDGSTFEQPTLGNLQYMD